MGIKADTERLTRAENRARAYRERTGLEGAHDKEATTEYWLKVETGEIEDPYTAAMKQHAAAQEAKRNPPPPVTNILLEANDITGNGGERNDSYDHPIHNFRKIAETWTTLLGDKLKDGATITPRNVVHLMVAMKLVRDTHKPKRDNILDIAGYARCAERLSEII